MLPARDSRSIIRSPCPSKLPHPEPFTTHTTSAYFLPLFLLLTLLFFLVLLIFLSLLMFQLLGGISD